MRFPIRSVMVDLLFIALFGSALGCIASNFLGLAPQFFAANYGLFMWAGFCALLFFLYVQFQDRALRPSYLRYLAFFPRVMLLFLIFVAGAVALEYWMKPQERGEWQLGAFFLSVPGAVAGSVGYGIGCAVRSARNR